MTLTHTLADFAALSPDKATVAEIRSATANKFIDAAEAMASALNLTEADLDALFTAASNITA